VSTIAVIDYGAGNLRSVQKAFEYLGQAAVVTSDPDAIAQAAGVVLPGQGAFGSCMEGLRARGLVEPTLAAIHSGRPFLGICVGMQLLFEESEEAPGVRGLGVFGGRIVRFPRRASLKIPQMGWNQLRVVQRAPALRDVPDGAYVYFVHSFYPVPTDASVAATLTDYGVEYVSSVARDNIYAGVFHPEKSQRVGLRILDNFVQVVQGRA